MALFHAALEKPACSHPNRCRKHAFNGIINYGDIWSSFDVHSQDVLIIYSCFIGWSN